MIKTVPFQTRARTIDHLGREQIADCPTAITELWKNSYDAYARNVSLHLFDGETPVAGIFDDGHGMCHEEFLNKWLVVGTDSKTSSAAISESDRDGLEIRPKQGQKGIGRLSCGAMGSLLFLISKRKNAPYVCSLIDWRIFENPFLLLSDISMPVAEFEKKEDVLKSLPEMLDGLLDNIWPKDSVSERGQRISAAWELFSSLERERGEEKTTSDKIAELIIDEVFVERHLSAWSVWNGMSQKGTALVMANLADSLIANLECHGVVSDINKEYRDFFFQTLSGFCDPYVNKVENNTFDYEFVVWVGQDSRERLSDETQFDRNSLLSLEHSIDGIFDEQGIFRGNIRAFGEDIGFVEIPPPASHTFSGPKSRVGPLGISIGTFEGNSHDTSHSSAEHSLLKEQATLYGGFCVYRDGLRVPPYGNTGSDFFEIDERRSRHAGREFWVHRQVFGRVAFTRDDNPNLRDKAGREGLIDNKARRSMQSLVVHFLKYVARQYFGSSSSIRQDRLPLIQEANAKAAEKSANEARRNNRSKFRNALKANRSAMDLSLEELEELRSLTSEALGAADADQLFVLQESVDGAKGNKNLLRLPPRPKKLGALEDSYFRYSSDYSRWCSMLDELSSSIGEQLEQMNPKPPSEIANSALRRQAKAVHDQIRKWKSDILSVLNSEVSRIENQVQEDNKRYDLAALPVLNNLDNGTIGLAALLKDLDYLRDDLLGELGESYEPYYRSIKGLSEGLDLDSASNWNSEEAERLGDELEQFTALAQLGITVELISHELERFDHTIGQHLRSLPKEIQESPDFIAAFDSHHELMERLRFLSPLKLSGASRTRTKITGELIFRYCESFFSGSFSQDDIQFEATDAFKGLVIQEFRSRIYPVFINLLNNARYWVSQQKGARKILLDFVDGKVVVADSGPGISLADQEHLFSLFFTKRMRGRGVGLYLCRTNLARGKHQISYTTDEEEKCLPGANFLIEFEGVKSE